MTTPDEHGWMPISEAPRDGTDVLVYSAEFNKVWPAYFPEEPETEGFAWRRWDHCIIPEPTHWQPLPQPAVSP